MLQNIPISKISKDKNLHTNFINSKINDFNLKCNIYNGDFYSDTFNFF